MGIKMDIKKEICKLCGKPIGDASYIEIDLYCEEIDAPDVEIGFYHEECAKSEWLICDQCRGPTPSLFKREEKKLCKSCFNNILICEYCKGKIEGEYQIHNNNYYHPGCHDEYFLICESCEGRFDEEDGIEFYEKLDLQLCKDCIAYYPTCDACGEPVREIAVVSGYNCVGDDEGDDHSLCDSCSDAWGERNLIFDDEHSKYVEYGSPDFTVTLIRIKCAFLCAYCGELTYYCDSNSKFLLCNYCAFDSYTEKNDISSAEFNRTVEIMHKINRLINTSDINNSDDVFDPFIKYSQTNLRYLSLGIFNQTKKYIKYFEPSRKFKPFYNVNFYHFVRSKIPFLSNRNKKRFMQLLVEEIAIEFKFYGRERGFDFTLFEWNSNLINIRFEIDESSNKLLDIPKQYLSRHHSHLF